MKYVKIVMQIGILSLFYLVGTWIEQLFHLFIPGSIIGMLLLLVVLLSKKFKESWISDGAGLMVNHIMIFFIPVTIGIINYLYIFNGKGLLFIPIVLGSTLLVMVISAATSQFLLKRKEREYE